MSEFINTIDELGDEVVLSSIINGTITEFKDNVLTEVGSYAFYKIENSLTKVVLPNVKTIGSSAFEYCRNLSYVDLGNVTKLEQNAFYQVTGLRHLIIRTNTVCDIFNTYTLNGSTMYKLYVPRALFEEYKAHSVWKSFSYYMRILEDYTVDGTTAGALDETKI